MVYVKCRDDALGGKDTPKCRQAGIQAAYQTAGYSAMRPTILRFSMHVGDSVMIRRHLLSVYALIPISYAQTHL